MRWMFAGYFAVVYLSIVLPLMWVAQAKGDLQTSVAFCGTIVPLLLLVLMGETYIAVSAATRDSIARRIRQRVYSRTYVFVVGVLAGTLGVLSAVLVATAVVQFSAPVWVTFIAAPVTIGVAPLIGISWLASGTESNESDAYRVAGGGVEV